MSTIISVAQFIRICRWLKLIYKEQLAPLENAPFSVQWARKRCRVAQRFRQYLRATNCYRSFWIPGSWHLRMGYTDAIPFCDPSQESNRAGEHQASHR